MGKPTVGHPRDTDLAPSPQGGRRRGRCRVRHETPLLWLSRGDGARGLYATLPQPAAMLTAVLGYVAFALFTFARPQQWPTLIPKALVRTRAHCTANSQVVCR